MGPPEVPGTRHAALLEIVVGLLFLGLFSLLLPPSSSLVALALVALVALRHGTREGLLAAVAAWGLPLTLDVARGGAGAALLRAAGTYVTLAFLLAGGVAFGAVGLAQRRALRALRERVNELELELADQGVRLLVTVEEKQELERRLARSRSPAPGP